MGCKAYKVSLACIASFHDDSNRTARNKWHGRSKGFQTLRKNGTTRSWKLNDHLCMYDPPTLKVSRAQRVRLQRRRMPLKGPKGSKPGPKRAEKHHIQFQPLELKKRPCIEEPGFWLRVQKNAHSRRSRKTTRIHFGGWQKHMRSFYTAFR